MPARRCRARDHRRQGGRGARARAGRRATSRRSPSAPDDGPGLATILVGDDPASAVYVGGKQKACARGRASRGFDHRLPADTPRGGGRRADRASSTPTTRVSGILCQLPVPGPPRRRASSPGSIDPLKDVDGLTPRQRRAARARPRRGCARARRTGVMELLAEAGAPARGRRGRRRRALQPLRQADGPAAARRQRDRHHLPLAHARPGRGLPPRRRAHRRGRPRRDGPGDWVKPGATVIDVGMNRTDDGLVRRRRLRRGVARSPARSRPCPAASGR